MGLSFKYSTNTMACLFSKMQEQVKTVVIWLILNGELCGIMAHLHCQRRTQLGTRVPVLYSNRE